MEPEIIFKAEKNKKNDDKPKGIFINEINWQI